MKNKFLIVLVVTVLYAIALYFVNGEKLGEVTNSVVPSPTPIARPNAPKTFQFDESTDLKIELEKVNPQILDSDFE